MTFVYILPSSLSVTLPTSIPASSTFYSVSDCPLTSISLQANQHLVGVFSLLPRPSRAFSPFKIFVTRHSSLNKTDTRLNVLRSPCVLSDDEGRFRPSIVRPLLTPCLFLCRPSPRARVTPTVPRDGSLASLVAAPPWTLTMTIPFMSSYHPPLSCFRFPSLPQPTRPCFAQGRNPKLFWLAGFQTISFCLKPAKPLIHPLPLRIFLAGSSGERHYQFRILFLLPVRND